MGRALGIGEDQLAVLASYQDSPLFSELEKLVLAYTDQLTRVPVTVPDELFARLRARFEPAQLVELTSAIAWENYRARFNRGFAIESEGFGETSCTWVAPAKAQSDIR